MYELWKFLFWVRHSVRRSSIYSIMSYMHVLRSVRCQEILILKLTFMSICFSITF